MALPVAVTVMGILLLVTGVAANAALDLTESANTDARAKQAIAAADAGVHTAMFRLNALQDQLDWSPTPCVVNSAAASASGALSGYPPTLSLRPGVTVNGQAWCEPSGPEAIGNGASFTYRLTPPLTGSADPDGVSATLDRRILATGTASGYTRRVLQTVSFVDVTRLLKELPVVATTALNLANSSHIGTIAAPAGVRSDGNISIADTAQVCGNATPGPSGSVSLSGSGSVCSGYSTTPAAYTVAVSSPSASGSSNAVLSTLCAVSCPPGITWTPATRTLKVSNAAALTLPPGTFLALCSLTVNTGGRVVAASTGATAATAVRILMDSPASCGGTSNLHVSGAASLVNALTDPAGLQIQAVGSGGTLGFAASSTVPPMRFTVLAPEATVNVSSSTQLVGGVIGSTVNLSGSSSVSGSTSLSGIVSSLIPLYRKRTFVECSRNSPDSTPDHGC